MRPTQQASPGVLFVIPGACDRDALSLVLSPAPLLSLLLSPAPLLSMLLSPAPLLSMLLSPGQGSGALGRVQKGELRHPGRPSGVALVRPK